MIESSILLAALCVLVGFLIVAVVILFFMLKDLSAEAKYLRDKVWERVPNYEFKFLKDEVRRHQKEFDALTADMGIVIKEEPSKLTITKFND